MKITLEIDGRKLVGKLPYDGADTVHFSDGEVCPHCKAKLIAKGQGIESHTHDTYKARAICVTCGAQLGPLLCKVSTIFGIEEDERVLSGRCRVY